MLNTFADSYYDTPSEGRRCLMDKLLLGTNLYFTLQAFRYIHYAASRAKSHSLEEFNAVYIHCGRGVADAVERCGGKIHVRGLENFDKVNGPAVIVGNHMSFVETNTLSGIIGERKKITYVIKSSLLKYPLFGDILRKINAVAVDRESPMADFKTVMVEGTKRLQEGWSLIVFPQHTRSEVFRPADFNSMGVKLAKRNGVPVIPLALKTDFCAKGSIIKDIGELRRDRDLHYEFGAPIDIKGNGKEEHQQVVDFISSRLRTWGGTVDDSPARQESAS